MAALKNDAAVLAKAIRALKDLTTPGSHCAVPDEAKQAVRLYIETWITPLVEAVQEDLAGLRSLPTHLRN